jgi:DMSO reductase anchor subunit
MMSRMLGGFWVRLTIVGIIARSLHLGLPMWNVGALLPINDAY